MRCCKALRSGKRAGNAEEEVSEKTVFGESAADDKMLFAVALYFRIGPSGKNHSGLRFVCGSRFVSEVET